MDKITLEAIKNVYVWLPAEVIEVSNNSLLKVQPLVYNENLPLPIINDVCVEHIGNEKAFINIKVNKGDIGIVIFSQMDMSNFMSSGTLSECDTSEIFNMTNCSFLPLKKWNKKGTIMPLDYDFEIVGNIRHTGTWTHIGDYKREGNSEIIGNVNIKGKLITEFFEVLKKAILIGINFITHKHGGVKTGGGKTGGAEK